MRIFIGFVPGIRAHKNLQVIHAPLFLVSQYAVGSIYFHKLKENVGENLTLKFSCALGTRLLNIRKPTGAMKLILHEMELIKLLKLIHS